MLVDDLYQAESVFEPIAALPVDISEKQMLLETVDAEARYANFIALIEGEFEIPESATRH